MSFGSGRLRRAAFSSSLDGRGFWLCQKRLSSGRFAFWPEAVTPTRAFEACELQVLLMGGDPRQANAAPA